LNNFNNYIDINKINSQLERADIQKKILTRNIYKEYELYLNLVRDLLFISVEKGLNQIYSYPTINDNFLNENEFYEEFQNSLFDDLNTPKALSIIGKNLNKIKEKNHEDRQKIAHATFEALTLLGLYKENKNDEDFDDTLIKKLINERNEARKLKNFEKADEIRQNLKNKNIEIEDTKDGTVWTKSK